MPASDGRGNRLNYNGTEVFDVLTKGVSETVVYDSTNTDMVATKVEISLTGLLSVAGVEDGGAATVDHQAGAEGAPFDNTIRRLNDSRKWFIYWVGDQPLYAVWPIEFWHLRHGEIHEDYCPSGVAENFHEENWWSAGLYDSAKIETGIINIVSDRTARVDIVITFTYIPCNSVKNYELPDTLNGTGGSSYVGDPNDHSKRVGNTLKEKSSQDAQKDEFWGSEYGICQNEEGLLEPTWESVLSNRWRTADNINTEDWLCERTISGTIEIVSRVGSIDSHSGPEPDINSKKAPISPHYVRFLTIPPLQNGFKRLGLSFSESEDNLKLEYEIKDKEVYVQSPWPACSFEASSSTSIKPLSGGMGSMPLVKVECSMMARKHVDKKLLLQAMVHVMNTKTNFLQTVSGFNCFPSSFEITESLSSNSIKGNLEVMLRPDDTLGSGGPFKSVMKFLTATFGQGVDSAEKGYKSGDEYRGLTAKTIPQMEWGAPEVYDAQRARKDLQYPDDCYLLGPLSSLFMPVMLGKHRLNDPSGAVHAQTQISYIGNTPCDPIITYDTKKKEVGPWTRVNSLKSGSGGIYDGHGKYWNQDEYDRKEWQERGPVTSPSTFFQENQLSGKDYILKSPSNLNLGSTLNRFPYLVYNIHVEYSVKTGREMITASNPKLPLTFPHNKTMPIAYKVYKFMAARVNSRPDMPLASDFVEPTSNLRHYLVDSKYNFANPVPSSDGLSVVYVVAGTLIYVMERPHLANEPIFNPTAPDLTSMPSELNFISIANFKPINSGTFFAT